MFAYVIESCDSTDVKSEFNEAEKSLWRWSWIHGQALFEKDNDQEAIDHFLSCTGFFPNQSYRLMTFPSMKTLVAVNTQDANQFDVIEGG
jgi:hypothetical protein